MSLPDGMYVIFDGSKLIGRASVPEVLDLRSCSEYIRSNFILEEVFLPFISIAPSDISIRDSSEYFIMTRQMSPDASRDIIIDKKTYLPILTRSKIVEKDMDLTQTAEIVFSDIEQLDYQTDTSLSIKHYLSQGFTIKDSKPTETNKDEPPVRLSEDQKNFLFQYPLVDEKGDTLILNSIHSEYLLLDFWYASCFPCLKALPKVNQLALKYAHEGLVVLGINAFDKGIMQNASNKLRSNGITIPLLFGDRDLTSQLKMNSFPTYLLLTPDEGILYIHGGVDEASRILEEVFRK
jgi:thiol-disulfide isomerase/thioredoxin